MELLGPVPTVWDETKVLGAQMGNYVIVARRNGSNWYSGAMTDWTPRDLDIDLSFLPRGRFKLTSFEDAANADRFGSDYKKAVQTVDRNSKLKIHMMGGGGWAARFVPSATQ